MADFHNQIESISPTVTNKLFSKLTDFTYTIEGSSISPDDSSKATVYVSMEYYDVGKAFETTMLEYIKNEITMTYDGKNDDDIEKKADIRLTKEPGKISDNITFLGEIPETNEKRYSEPVNR